MVTYDPATALLVVDVQNDFADPGGSLYVGGGEEVVAFVNAEIARARVARAPVLYTQDWHPATTPHFQKDGGVWPVHCVHGSWGAEFHPELDVEGIILRINIYKHAGYFPPEDAEPHIEQCKKENVTVPVEILKRFVERYRTE